MSKKTILIICVLSLVCFASCIKQYQYEEVYGYYSPYNYINTFDTIQIDSGGIYRRKVYDKNRKLVKKMEGKWKLVSSNTQIQFNSFYLNLDNDLVKFPPNVEDSGYHLTTSVDSENGKIQFCVGHDAADLPDQNCYRKIGN